MASTKVLRQLGMMVHICNPNTREAEGGESQVPGQPRLHSDTLSQKTGPEEGAHLAC
jgi:hypothetical protein